MNRKYDSLFEKAAMFGTRLSGRRSVCVVECVTIEPLRTQLRHVILAVQQQFPKVARRGCTRKPTISNRLHLPSIDVQNQNISGEKIEPASKTHDGNTLTFVHKLKKWNQKFIFSNQLSDCMFCVNGEIFWIGQE